MPSDLIIDDGTHSDLLFPAGKGRGLVERDYSRQPMRAVDMPLIPRGEWSDRIKELVRIKAQLSDVWRTGDAGKPIPHLDQGPWGYCWAHSATHAVMMARAINGLPYVPLSAFAVAATIKQGRDEGGWGALALDFIGKNGVPDQKYWPQGSADLGHNTPDCWRNAANHKAGEAWADVAAPVYDRELSFDQVATCLLLGVPVVCDFRWWSHSVLAVDLVEVEPGSFGPRILNQWKGWGDEQGMAVLQGQRAIPSQAVALRTVTASEV